MKCHVTSKHKVEKTKPEIEISIDMHKSIQLSMVEEKNLNPTLPSFQFKCELWKLDSVSSYSLQGYVPLEHDLTISHVSKWEKNNVTIAIMFSII